MSPSKNSANHDLSIIEDFLPIEVIGEASSREKSTATISSLHLWWARRPLVSCRVGIYSSLVQASRFRPSTGALEKRPSLGRANAARFINKLCATAVPASTLSEAESHILADTGTQSRPRVLDMFAGGGAIPLEALRLGCDAFALDLNPVAYIVELCTTVYPQLYGKPDPAVCGSGSQDTWAGLASEVTHWGKWVSNQAKVQIGDLFSSVRDPRVKAGKSLPKSRRLWAEAQGDQIPEGYLSPIAYLWTRAVTCKNPTCRGTVPLLRNSWLAKKEDCYVALKPVRNAKSKTVKFEVVTAKTVKGLGFEPDEGSKGGNATCPFCGTIADADFIKAQGVLGHMKYQLTAVACSDSAGRGRVYLSAEQAEQTVPEATLERRINELCSQTGMSVPKEPLPAQGTLGFRVQPYGFKQWGQLFASRQLLALLTFAACIRAAEKEMIATGYSGEQTRAIVTYLGMYVDRAADHWSSFCTWNSTGQKLQHTYGRQALPMVWDFAEANPFGGSVGDWNAIVENAELAIRSCAEASSRPASVSRGTATSLPWGDAEFDAVITDPPYYDNVPYADLSDFFYVWLKRTIGHLYPEHFASELTPKKSEAIAEPVRYGGSAERARAAYEQMMRQSFSEAYRVLKPGRPMLVVYAHKTTLGWTTLVDALRQAGFTVTEAWPLDTELKTRLRGMESAALASSIFLVARKRQTRTTGNFEEEVRPDLHQIVRERVQSLWELGVSGADLVIACVGAGLRAFTRFEKVEYSNGEQVPAERFLAEVESVVLDAIFERLSKSTAGDRNAYSLEGVDPATRFYIIWRYTYRLAELDSGEAIIFANGTHVELDGINGLSAGAQALVVKKKGKYTLLDYAERGGNAAMGMPSEDSQPAPIIDALHRILWLMDHKPSLITEFLKEARPNLEQMRLVAQALLGPALKGGELGDVSPTGELGALAKLTANWKSVVEDAREAPLFRAARKGQE